MNKFYENKKFARWISAIDSFLATHGDSYYLLAKMHGKRNKTSHVLDRIAEFTDGERFTFWLEVRSEIPKYRDRTQTLCYSFILEDTPGTKISTVCNRIEKKANQIVDDLEKGLCVDLIVDSDNTRNLVIGHIARALAVYSDAFIELGEVQK